MLQRAQMQLVRGVAYMAFPLGGMAVLAPELVLVVLGDKWREAVLPLQALCISEAVASITNLQATFRYPPVAPGPVQHSLCTGHARAIAIGAWQGGLAGVGLAWAVTFPLLAIWLNHEALRCSGQRLSDLWTALQQLRSPPLRWSSS